MYLYYVVRLIFCFSVLNVKIIKAKIILVNNNLNLTYLILLLTIKKLKIFSESDVTIIFSSCF